MNFAHYGTALAEKRVIHIDGDINADRLNDFRKQMYVMLEEPSKKELVIGLNTSGGSTYMGMVIYYDLLALQKERKIWLICQGRVQSMGTYIMLSVPKERRVANPLTEWYCHEGKMSWKTDTYASPDTHETIWKEYGAAIKDMRREQTELVNLLVRSTDLNAEMAWDLIRNPRHVYEKEAIKFGFIDHVLKGED